MSTAILTVAPVATAMLPLDLKASEGTLPPQPVISSDPAVGAVRRYRRIEAVMVAMSEEDVVDHSGQEGYSDALAEYRAAWAAVIDAVPTTRQGRAALFGILLEDMEDGQGDVDPAHKTILAHALRSMASAELKVVTDYMLCLEAETKPEGEHA